MQRTRSAALVGRTARTIARYDMVAPGDRVLVALSGGPDSVALLAALHQLAGRLMLNVSAAHFNHGWRGAESARDQACAEAVAARLGVPCVVGVAAAAPPRRNREADARADRYAFLERVAATERCGRIATGHTADDQAETLLMRLLRGAGVDGVASIPPVRDHTIIRPLIAWERQDVLAFLAEQELPFCHDSSNDDRRLLRNRLRHEILPVLRAVNPRAVQRLAAAAALMAAERTGLDAWAADRLGAAPRLTSSVLRAAVPELRGRLVRAWLRGCRGDLRRISADHVQAIIEVACGGRPNGAVALPGGRVVRAYDTLAWVGAQPPIDAPGEQALVPGATAELGGGWRIRAAVDDDPNTTAERPGDLWTCFADADRLSAPLRVRRRRPGDRIQPLGLGGHRKLQDVFVDRKVPRAMRRVCPVVTAADTILWVPGLVRSAHALVGPGTRSVLRLTAEFTGVAGGKGLC